MSLIQRFEKGLQDAFVSRGKKKGLLKAQCPPMNTEGAAVWQAIMSESNPYKIGFGHLLFMSTDNKEVFNLTLRVAKIKDLTRFDRDANFLKELGIW